MRHEGDRRDHRRTGGAGSDLHRHVEEGTSFSEAMARHPRCFDAVCRSLVAAGESSGQLEQMLDRLARLTRQQLRIRRTVTAALVYPSLLVAIGIVVVIVMTGFVLPRFEGLFQSLDAPLPPSTEFLMSVGELLRSGWWVLLTGLVVAGAATAAALATESGRRFLDVSAVRLPYFGRITRDLLTARFTRLLGVLLDSKVPLLEALQLTRDSTGNSVFAELLEQGEEAVVRGETLSAVLLDSPLVNPCVSEAIRHGEQSGAVSPVLLDMADYMDEENESVVRTAARLLEPVILIVLGVVVAVIAISLFMPLFDPTSLTGGGR
ncbi:MAG: type II secretion system F family protein [Planctomycetota bacterium]|jgi:type II secretory pathway component PulF